MAAAKISYLLSTNGQKVSLLAGGDGQTKQTLTVERDAPEFAAVLTLANVSSTGEITWDFRRQDRSGFETPQTAADLLAFREQEIAEKAAAEKASAERITAETLIVLRERRTRTISNSTIRAEQDGCVCYSNHTYQYPDWPCNADPAVKESPEAKAWEAELEAAKAASLIVAEERAKAELAVKLAEKTVKEAAKAVEDGKRTAWREANGIEDGDVCLRIEDGAIVNLPPDCWESHNRGKNWMAIITVSPSSPGGLSRDFANKAKGGSYYMLPTLSIGDAVEFGADYYSGGGKKSAKRWYGFFVKTFTGLNMHGEQERTWIVLRECAGGKSACKAAQKYAAQQSKQTA